MPEAITFVVRIYPRADQPGETLAGVVETVRDGMWHPFAGFEELRAILEAHALPGPGTAAGARSVQKTRARRP